MIVKNISNQLHDVHKDIREYALTQVADGIVDTSPGKHYAVFAVMQTKPETLYFVHTDTLNKHSLWWMPASLYEVIDGAQAEGWVEEKSNGSTLLAYPSLYQPGVEEGIIDGEQDAIKKYMTEVKKDPTFPSDDKVEQLNQAFHKQEQMKKYQEDLRLARERGYEFPQKPQD